MHGLAGWMSPKTLETYLHVRGEARRRAVELFE
jgi:hypothetical protein